VTLHLGCTDADLARAASLLRAGGIVAFPTETVYGLGARADDPAAVARVFAAKGRVSTNPLIVHVASLSEARALAACWPESAERAGAALWPGPLTLVVPVASGAVAYAVTAGGPTVGIRIPAHPVARRLLELVGAPVAAPSANRSLALSPTSPEHVRKTLEGRIDALVHGGACEVGLESTVIDLAADPPRVLRPGGLALGDLTPFVPGLVKPPPHATDARPGEPARAPGQQAKHYSPSVPLHLAPAHELEQVVAALSGRVGVLALGARITPCHTMVTLPSDAARYGALLFDALHALDEACDAIVVELPPHEPGWEAVQDRLARAAAS
jgi:L-threonylcarbamoyladenylate synthase